MKKQLLEKVKERHKALIKERDILLRRTDSLLANTQTIGDIPTQDLIKALKWWKKFAADPEPLFPHSGTWLSINKDLQSEDIEVQLLALVDVYEYYKERKHWVKELKEFSRLGPMDHYLPASTHKERS